MVLNFVMLANRLKDFCKVFYFLVRYKGNARNLSSMEVDVEHYGLETSLATWGDPLNPFPNFHH